MTQQEYKQIRKALEDVTETIIQSFDKFIEEIKLLREEK